MDRERKSDHSLLWHCLMLRQQFQMKFMSNEYKSFLLESIVLSAILTACCSPGSNRFHQEVWACCLKTVRAKGNPYIYRLLGFEMFRINAIFIHSTTSGNRHLMKAGRAACRPIEGEEIPIYKDFSV